MHIEGPESIQWLSALDANFACLSLCTTGLIDAEGMPGIVGIGITVVSGGAICDAVELPCRPSRPISAEASRIHGIHDSEAQTFPPLDEQWQSLSDYLDNETIVTHNSAFHWSIVHHHINKAKLPALRPLSVQCSMAGTITFCLLNNLFCAPTGASLETLTRFTGVHDDRWANDGKRLAAAEAQQLATVILAMQKLYRQTVDVP